MLTSNLFGASESLPKSLGILSRDLPVLTSSFGATFSSCPSNRHTLDPFSVRVALSLHSVFRRHRCSHWSTLAFTIFWITRSSLIEVLVTFLTLLIETGLSGFEGVQICKPKQAIRKIVYTIMITTALQFHGYFVCLMNTSIALSEHCKRRFCRVAIILFLVCKYDKYCFENTSII